MTDETITLSLAVIDGNLALIDQHGRRLEGIQEMQILSERHSPIHHIHLKIVIKSDGKNSLVGGNMLNAEQEQSLIAMIKEESAKGRGIKGIRVT
jgi:hypothetical protein